MSALPASAYPSAAAIKRVCNAAKALGIKVAGFRVEPGGAIAVFEAAANTAEPVSELDEWRAKRKKG